MAYASWSVVFGEQPSAAKWNILGTNDASFNDGTGIGTSVIGNTQLNSGVVVQALQTDYSADTNGSTILPTDNTIPQITEGFEVMTQAISPKASGNLLLVQAVALMGGNTANRSFVAAIFQDSTANALAAVTQFQAQSGGDVVLTVGCKVTAASTSSTTFRIRIGSDNGGTTVVFGNSRFDTIPHSYIRVMEYKA